MGIADTVDGHEVVHRDVEMRANAGKRVAATNLVEVIARLRSVALVCVDPCECCHHRAPVQIRGKSQLEATWHVFHAPPHRAPQGRIVVTQRCPIDTEHTLQRADTDVVGNRHDVGLGRSRALQLTEVFLGIEMDFHGSQKGDIEVARRKAEAAAVVATHDGRNVAGAEPARCAPHARRSVIVGGDGQGPATGHRTIVAEQPGGRHGGRVRIHALVHAAIDSQITATRGARELPQARGTDSRARLGVIGRFHVG